MFRHILTDIGRLRRHPGFRTGPLVVLCRTVLWALHCAISLPARAWFARWKFTIVLPPVWSGGGGTLAFLFREHYERDVVLLEKLLGPGMTFIDGGANVGVYTCTAARLVGPEGRVLAFEPGSRCYAALALTLSLNGFAQVEILNEALSDRRGAAQLYHHHARDDCFSLGPSPDTEVPYREVRTTTIDEAVADAGVSNVSLIKLDIEGAQELALRGAERTLRAWHPSVLLEVDGGATRRLGLETDGAGRFLADLGYEFYRVDERGGTHPEAKLPQSRTTLAVYGAKAVTPAATDPLRVRGDLPTMRG